MSLKLKVLGLGLLATLVMSAIGAMNASATSSGHFVSDSPIGPTTLTGTEIPSPNHPSPHRTEISAHGLEGRIVCEVATYHGTMNDKTSTHITIVPHYTTCKTQTGAHNVTIHTNGCSYTFTPGHQGTVHIDCPVGKSIEITHPNCTITVPPQTVGTAAKGVTYTNVFDDNGSNKHTITLDANTVQLTTYYHAGICIFTGTNHTGTLHGGVIVRGHEDHDDTTGEQVNITHTAT